MKKLIVTFILLMAIVTGTAYAGSITLTDNVDAQREMALRFFRSSDYDKALPWINKAVKNDDPTAMYLLSLLYQWGKAVERDPAQAFAWSLKSAELGNTMAQFNVGKLYYSGAHNQGQPDYAQAFRWFDAASAEGWEEPLYCTAVMLIHGEGVPENTGDALRRLETVTKNSGQDSFIYLWGSYANHVSDMRRDDAKLFVWLQTLMHDDAYKEATDSSNFRHVVNEVREELIKTGDWERTAALLKERGITVDRDVNYLE